MYKLRHFLYFRHLYCEEILILDIRHINKVADWKCFFSFVFLPPLFDKQPSCCQFIIYQTSRLRDILWRHHLLVYENENTKTAHADVVFFFFQLHTHTSSPPLSYAANWVHNDWGIQVNMLTRFNNSGSCCTTRMAACVERSSWQVLITRCPEGTAGPERRFNHAAAEQRGGCGLRREFKSKLQ